ncbi:MAG: sugar ABC transporter permease [Clostridiaceae bacterium]|nr:sugar ABC transporter permease [Clostridiaceae bacterium]
MQLIKNRKLFSVINKKRNSGKFKDQLEFLAMCAPASILLLIFSYLPMIGLILPFKEFRYDVGIFSSKWVGLKNFNFFFSSSDAFRITRNTIGLNFLFIITGTVVAIGIALMLFEIKNKHHIKIYQTLTILPNFISYVVAGYITYSLFNPVYGVLNHLLTSIHLAPVQWYSEPNLWPGILTLTNLWKGVGMASIIYYAALMGIDSEYFEAAAIDGASKFKATIYITLPFLVPLVTILTILSIGGIFRSDFGLFYQITRNIGLLYSTTDVIDTYIFRALKTVGDFNMASAVGLYQALVGFVLVMVTNKIVKKISPDSSLF